jgi:hypothetical protein
MPGAFRQSQTMLIAVFLSHQIEIADPSSHDGEILAVADRPPHFTKTLQARSRDTHTERQSITNLLDEHANFFCSLCNT